MQMRSIIELRYLEILRFLVYYFKFLIGLNEDEEVEI